MKAAEAERSPLPRVLLAPDPGPVLAFAPHPDDDVLGAGLTLRLHRLQGDPVRMIVVYDGALGRLGGTRAEGEEREALVRLRREESLAGGRILGVVDYEFWNYPEGHLPGPADLIAAAERVAEVVRRDAPATVYAPWVGEQHVDHHALGRAVRLGLALADFRGTALGYEVWSPLQPTLVVDVSAAYEEKARALLAHRSQTVDTDLVHMVRGLNAHRSLYLPKGSRYGEAFAPLGAPHPEDAALIAGRAPAGG